MIYKITWVIRAYFYKPFLGKLGKMSYLGKPVYIGNFRRIFIGDNVRIFPGARIEVVNNDSSITFDNDISIGQNVHITSASNLTIQSKTTLASDVTITNIDHEYQLIGKSVINQPYLVQKTIIGENCYLGKGCIIQAGTTLGKQCVVGSNSVVRGIFPDFSVIVGSPAIIIKRYNKKTQTWARTDAQGSFL